MGGEWERGFQGEKEQEEVPLMGSHVWGGPGHSGGPPHFWGAHPRDRPLSPCSSQGDDFWDNPGVGHRGGR